MTFKTILDNTLINTLCGLFCIVMGVDDEDDVFFTSNFSSSEKQKNIMQLMEFRTGAMLRNTKQFILGWVLTGANPYTVLGP